MPRSHRNTKRLTAKERAQAAADHYFNDGVQGPAVFVDLCQRAIQAAVSQALARNDRRG